MIIKENIKLVVVPARILEKVIGGKHELTKLADYEAMKSILTPEDLLFYTGVNSKLDTILDPQIIKAFGYDIKETDGDIWDETPVVKEVTWENLTQNRLDEINVYMSANYDGESRNYLPHIANCNSVNALQHSNVINVNNYVAQYFAIDTKTIGVTLTITDEPRTAKRNAVEGLLGLLYDDYLLNQNHIDNTYQVGMPLDVAERNSFCLRELSLSGLVNYYSELIC